MLCVRARICVYVYICHNSVVEILLIFLCLTIYIYYIFLKMDVVLLVSEDTSPVLSV